MYVATNWSIFDESLDYYILTNWYRILTISEFQLYMSFLLDYFVESSILKLPFLGEWHKNVFDSLYSAALYNVHPELLMVRTNIAVNNYLFFSSSLYSSLYTSVSYESFNLVIFSIVHYLVVLFILSIFFILYFSPYTTYTQEDSVDMDYSATSLLIEAEKEISSIDDIILFSVAIFYIFGWFFYLNVFTFLSSKIYTASILILLPFFFFTIIGIPTLLIYDFGLYFLVYLRGAGATSLFLFELLFDYIAIMVFYTRIVVQNIRLLLMFFTLISLYDVFIFFSLSTQNLFKSLKVEEYYNVDYMTDANVSYSFLFLLLNKIFLLMYEVLHTYFIVMVQFISFFAIVFWLFLFLYTFFVLEKHENYFTAKRLERALFFKNNYDLKKNN
jgi:hypothetical protein